MVERVDLPSRLDPAQQIETEIPSTARVIRRVYEAYFGRLGLTLTQAMVIGNLMLDPTNPLNQTELAHRIGIRKAALGPAIDALVVRQLISREQDPTDGRARLVSLTRRGQQVSVEVDRAFGEMAAIGRQNTTERDRRILVKLLTRIRSDLERFEEELGAIDAEGGTSNGPPAIDRVIELVLDRDQNGG